jgi:hypothetical protein
MIKKIIRRFLVGIYGDRGSYNSFPDLVTGKLLRELSQHELNELHRLLKKCDAWSVGFGDHDTGFSAYLWINQIKKYKDENSK